MKKISTMVIIGLLCFSMFPILAPRAKAETSKWIAKDPLPRPQALFGMTTANGKVYAIGGQYQGGGPTPAWSDANYEYDPISDSWTSKASMPTKRTTLTTVSVNDKIYAIGGAASTSGGAFSTNEEFDPASNSWTTKAPMPTPRNWISAAAVNDKIYVIGGSDNSGGIFSMNEMYDPLTDTWTTKKPDPQARLACGIGVVNGKIYLIGGWVRPGAPPGEPTTLNEEYDPQTDTWSTKAPMPTGRNGLTVAVMNNRIYAIGGATDFNPWTNNLNVVEEYDPSTDTWIAVQSMPTSRSLLGAAVAKSRIYAIGGWGSTGYLDTNEELSTGAPVGYWKFDEGSGTTAYDSSGNGNTGELMGNPQWVNGIAGTSLQFDGIDDVVMVPSSSSLVVARVCNQLTLETWMKPTVALDSNSNPMYLMTKGNEYGFTLGYEGTPPVQNGKIRFCMGLVDPSTHYILPEEIWTTTDVWTAGTWYHLVATYDGEFMKIYVNGVLENSLSAPGTLWTQEPYYTEYPFSIGAYTWGMPYVGNLFFFNGVLDEVKIYNYARTAQDILNDYNIPAKPDFEISVSPKSQIGQPDSSVYYQIAVTSKNGFSSSVTLDVSFSPNPLNYGYHLLPTDTVTPPPDGRAIRTLEFEIYSDTPLKTFAITVTADSGAITKADSATLSVERSLEVPYQNQDDTEWCGPTSVAMILQYYGRNFHSWDYAEMEHLSTDDGTTMDELCKFINHRFYPEVYALEPELYDANKVRSSISGAFPLLISVTEAPTTKIGHNVVIVGFNDSGVFVNDPSGALFDPVFLGASYCYPESYNHAYVTWASIESTARLTIEVRGTAPSVPSGRVWVEDKNGISFKASDHEHRLQMDRGLQWLSSDSKNDGYIMPVGSDLSVKLYVSNGRATSTEFTCHIYVHEEGDSFELCSESISREAFRYNDQPIAEPMDYVNFYVQHEELDGHLTKERKYWLEIDLHDDTSGDLNDYFYTPPFYWESGQTGKLKEKGKHLYFHGYDAQGNHVGLNYTSGQVELEIPESYYFDDGNGTTTIVFPKIIDLKLLVDATYAEDPIESYDLSVTLSIDTGVLEYSCSRTITAGEKQEFAVKAGVESLALISWENEFIDTKRGTVLKISTDDKYFQFIAPGKDYGVKYDPKMFVKYGIIVICYGDAEMRLTATAVDGYFHYCTALAYDKQTRKTYVLIDKPYGPRCPRLYEYL